MAKSRDAFRTISEVSEWLQTPAHVLRFWESRFSQIKPVKRAGGRRYYRPSDMRLLGGIKRLLHDDGITIKGVQKILREKGVKYVASLCVEPLDGEGRAQHPPREETPTEAIETAPSPEFAPQPDPAPQGEPAQDPARDPEPAHAAEPAPEPEPEPETEPAPEFQPDADPAPAPGPIRFDGDALGKAPIAVAEIDEDTREARIVALYQRLQALRDRVRGAMDAG